MIEFLKSSEAWDSRYDLPLYPKHNNPLLYLAYFIKLLTNEKTEVTQRAINHLSLCEIKPGLLDRWPDGSGGLTSHDELIGAAYISPEHAKRIIDYLVSTDGIYCNIEPLSNSERYNLYRMYWAITFIRARAGFRIGIIGKLALSIFYIASALSKDDGMSHHLLCWIMSEQAYKIPIVSLAAAFWEYKISKKSLSGKEMLNRYFPDLHLP